METQETITKWADDTFGVVQNPITSITRLNKEVAELLHEVFTVPHSLKLGDEIADIAIVLYRVASVLRVDLQDAVDLKMSINRKREWKLDGSGHGQHVGE